MTVRSIVGREAELDALRSFLHDQEGPALALLVGEAGVGKTSLLTSVAAEAPQRVLWTRPTQAEASSSYAALDDMFRPALGFLPRLADPQRRALEAALLLSDARTEVEPRLVALACRSLLEELAEPVVLAIDDWQWLDAASAAVLDFLLRRLSGAEAKVIATVRLGEADEAVAALVHRLRDNVMQVTVQELDAAALHALVHDVSGQWLSPPALDRMLRRSGGNPLVALELIRAPGAGPAIGVRRLLGRRIAALSPEARELLRYIAALADPTTDIVEQAVDRSDATRGLEEALAAEVLEREGTRLRFSHPLLAAVAEERTPPSEWRAIHARLAEIVSDPEERAHHLFAASTGPDTAVAAMLERGSAHAAARGATAAAAELAERAAALTPEGDVGAWLRRALVAADAHIASADGSRARRILEDLVRRAPAGAPRGQALHKLACLIPDPSAFVLAERALTEAKADDGLLSDIHLNLSNLCVMRGMGLATALAHADAALVHAERADADHLVAAALAGIAYDRWVGGAGTQREMLLRADQLERASGVKPWDSAALAILGMQLLVAGELDEARSLLKAERDRASRLGYLDLESFACRLLAELEIRAGHWDAAETNARRCFDLTQGSAFNNLEGCGQWARAIVDAHLGRVDSARKHALSARTHFESIDDLAWTTRATHVLGFLELSLGDGSAAVDLLAPLPKHERRIGVREPAMFCIRPDLIEALVMTGELDTARDVLAELEDLTRAANGRWAIATALRCRGQVAAAEGRSREAVEILSEAIKAHADVPQPFDHARTLLALGTAQRRAKQRGDARASLEASLETFDILGAGLWTRRARSEIARLGGRRARDRDELTETERRIAELAGMGRSNREIAGELFVSERTVESNLTRTYRKLGVRSRTELARRLPAE
jgi:DNA-binding CsgD family transcriptional regulator